MPLNTQMPAVLYKALPYLYALFGIGVLATIHHPWGVFSGIIFLLASVWVFYMRRVYKRARQGRLDALKNIKRIERAENHESRLERLEWRSSYRLGHPVIDEQHKQLFSLSRTLLKAIASQQPKSELDFFIATLIADLTFHFKTEEEVLAAKGKSLAKSHHQAHFDLLEQGNALALGYQRGEVAAQELAEFIIDELITQHTLGLDKACAFHH